MRRVPKTLQGSVLGKVINLALGNTLVTFPPVTDTQAAVDVPATLIEDQPNQLLSTSTQKGQQTKLNALDVRSNPVVESNESMTSTPSKNAPVDISRKMAEVPKSTIIAASPRVGKGVVVSVAIAHLRQLHPDLEIWLIDPKDEPTEQHYWAAIDPDKRCHFDLRDFDVDVEGAIEAFSENLTRFNRSKARRKLLIIDEFVTLNQKCAGQFMTRLKDFVVGICSSGEVNPDLGIGRFDWVLTQSPYVSDLGFKTKAALSSFQRVFLLSKASTSLYQLAVSASFVPDKFEDKVNRLLESTGRIFYYSRADSWHSVPVYNLPSYGENTLLRERLEGLLPGLDEWRKYFPEAPEAVEEAVFLAYQKALEVEGGKKKFITEILKSGTGGRKYQAASAYLDYLSKKFG